MNNEYYGFIYLTTNLISEKKYIGMHKGVASDNYLGSGKLLIRAIKKYGKENFSREILAYAKDKEELGKLEKHYIELYNATLNSNFYNIHPGGFGGSCMDVWDEERKKEYKEKMSLTLKNSKKMKLHLNNLNQLRKTKSYKRNHYNKRIMSEATILKMREINLGEKNPNYGNYWSEEKKKQLSELRIKNGKSKGELNGMFGKKGNNAINNKKVYMYDENFNLVKEFHTVGLALEFLNIKGHSQLNNAIKNKTIYKGYYWSK